MSFSIYIGLCIQYIRSFEANKPTSPLLSLKKTIAVAKNTVSPSYSEHFDGIWSREILINKKGRRNKKKSPIEAMSIVGYR